MVVNVVDNCFSALKAVDTFKILTKLQHLPESYDRFQFPIIIKEVQPSLSLEKTNLFLCKTFIHCLM